MFDYFKKKIAKKEQKQHLEYLKDYYHSLDSIPYSEMFRALREEGHMKSLQEMQDSNLLTSDIISIWNEMKEEMFLMSLDIEKIKKLYDMNLMYFVSYEMYERWSTRLRRFLKELCGLDSINSFQVVSGVGQLYFINPFGKEVDSSHDSALKAELEDYFRKAGWHY